MISIDWANKIISIPKSYMTLIQTSPFEIRELNINTFRLDLDDLQDDAEGMIFPDTHSHNTEISVGGVTLARVVTIINGYTITFEDGNYAVNLVGANSNIADVVNLNSVMIRSANSAGLTSSFSSAQLVDEIWDKDLSTKTVAGTAGKKLNDAGSAGDPWGTALPGSYSEGTAGYKLSTLENSISGTSAINTIATGFNLTTGIETGSYTDTNTYDGTYHTLDDVGNNIDCYYEFSVGDKGVPVQVTAVANLQSANDSMGVYGYNFTSSTWHQIGTLPGTGSASLSQYTFAILANLVSEDGIVRIRFAGGSSNPSLQIDFLYVSYSVIETSSNYSGRAISGTDNTIVLSSTASSLDNYYYPALIVLTSGTGAGQSRRIDSYIGSTKTATIATNWVTNPDNTTRFTILPWGSVRVSDIDDTPSDQISSKVWDKPLNESSVAGSIGEYIQRKVLTTAKFLGLK